MKQTVKLSLAIALLMLAFMPVMAQKEFSKKVDPEASLQINRMISDLDIRGYDGNELIITAGSINPPPERAEGLRSLYNDKTDNTGIGLVVEQSGNMLMLEPASKQGAEGEYMIKVPSGMSLKIDCSSPFAGDVTIENITGELDITTMGGDIELSDITGPVVASSINGNVKALFGKLSQEGPTSIESINGEIDLSIPASTPADLKLGTINGDIYTNFDIEMEKEKEGMKRIGGSHNFEGEINGGGTDLKLKSINSMIYLRKK